MEEDYLKLLKQILDFGEDRNKERTGEGTLALFGETLRFDLRLGFPLLTTKKVHFKSIVGELLWFLSGSTSNKELVEKYGVTIWNEWADEDGNLGPVYGWQWRHFGGNYNLKNKLVKNGVDQIHELVNGIIQNPQSRRHLVSAWNPVDVPDMALPPCHYSFQCFVSTTGELDLLFNMRSCDVALGCPFNIASYALLCHIIAKRCNLTVRNLIANLGDTHLYLNTLEGIKTQLSRKPFPFPTLEISDRLTGEYDIALHEPEDFRLINYRHHPTIKMQVAV